jgi:glycosyltransferase involved in cell wall biosynthesis
MPASAVSAGAVPRVAFFTDSFHETNGVALTSRQFAAFAKDRFYAFFSVHAGPRTAHWKRGNFETFELAHSRARLRLEHDLDFDLLFLRHRAAVRRALRAFAPDLIHVTGPGHMGLLGALLARDLRVPLVASWHTNVHEFGARRLARTLPWMPVQLTARAESAMLALTIRFYQLARLLFAPNPELVQMLATRTRAPVHLMQRGIDAGLFHPAKRPPGDRPFTIGYVGRLSAEKNVRVLAQVDRTLRQAGRSGYRFLIAGDGSERAWLRDRIPTAELPGVLHGEALATAYASMDVFLFPSETDTFGNVILEAGASGVPAIVSAAGGPKYLVEENVTGFVAREPADYARYLERLMTDPAARQRMGAAARQAALERQWSAVFDRVYLHYRQALRDGTLPAVRGDKTFLAVPVS